MSAAATDEEIERWRWMPQFDGWHACMALRITDDRRRIWDAEATIKQLQQTLNSALSQLEAIGEANPNIAAETMHWRLVLCESRRPY